MIFIDLSNHFYRDLDKHILSINEIEKYVFDLVNYLEIQDYILDVDFIESEDNLGTYSFETLMIKLNIPKIIQEAKDIYKVNKLTGNEILFINLNIIQAVLHEVVHGIQNCNLNEYNYAYNILYAKELEYKNIISEELYNKYYYLFSYERDAIITSLENILHIIKCHYKDEERTFTYFLADLYRFMMMGYTINMFGIKSPAEKIYEELYHENTPTLSNIDIYDKIKLGYQVPPKKFRKFKKNKTRKILSKNNLL